MRVLAKAFYELDRDESFTVRIDCEGGTYIAVGNVNNFELSFDEDLPEADVTPAILAGPHSMNTVSLHLVYSKDIPAQHYRITVRDREGTVVDEIDSGLNPDRSRPYRVDVELIVRVR